MVIHREPSLRHLLPKHIVYTTIFRVLYLANIFSLSAHIKSNSTHIVPYFVLKEHYSAHVVFFSVESNLVHMGLISICILEINPVGQTGTITSDGQIFCNADKQLVSELWDVVSCSNIIKLN